MNTCGQSCCNQVAGYSIVYTAYRCTLHDDTHTQTTARHISAKVISIKHPLEGEGGKAHLNACIFHVPLTQEVSTPRLYVNGSSHLGSPQDGILSGIVGMVFGGYLQDGRNGLLILVQNMSYQLCYLWRGWGPKQRVKGTIHKWLLSLDQCCGNVNDQA